MKKNDTLEVNHIYFLFLFFFFILSLRIFYLGIFRQHFLQNLARKQHYRLIPLKSPRGKILDREGRILARDLNCYSVFADPLFVDNLELTAKALSSNLDLSGEKVRKKLEKKKRFVWIKRKISWEKKEKISSLNLGGIGFIRETTRFYPQGNLASSVLGVVDIDDKGLDGVELVYDRYLKGKKGWIKILQDAAREFIFTPQAINPLGGADIILTIDVQIQYWVEKYLYQAIKEFSAKEASAVIMDALRGEILALANYPGFDPNNTKEISLEQMRNRAVVDCFEPGSVFKIVTLLAAIEENKFSDEDKFFCEEGEFKIPATILHDWRPFATLTFKEIFINSSNIGIAKVVSSLDKEKFYDYIKKLGFGQKTGIDLPGETGGMLKLPSKWSKTSRYIIPIGQEVGVNLVQLVRAFGVVANGGYLVKPHIVKEICFQNSSQKIPVEKERVISPSCAKRAKNILIEVVEEGTGKRAKIPGVNIGGKTGTAQKYDPAQKGYSSRKYRATFIGFLTDGEFPLVIGVTIDEPKKHYFGGVVAAPLFKKIAQEVIKYLEGEKSYSEK